MQVQQDLPDRQELRVKSDRQAQLDRQVLLGITDRPDQPDRQAMIQQFLDRQAPQVRQALAQQDPPDHNRL